MFGTPRASTFGDPGHYFRSFVQWFRACASPRVFGATPKDLRGRVGDDGVVRDMPPGCRQHIAANIRHMPHVLQDHVGKNNGRCSQAVTFHVDACSTSVKGGEARPNCSHISNLNCCGDDSVDAKTISILVSLLQQVVKACHLVAGSGDFLAIDSLQDGTAAQVLGASVAVFFGHLAILEHIEDAAVFEGDGLLGFLVRGIACERRSCKQRKSKDGDVEFHVDSLMDSRPVITCRSTGVHAYGRALVMTTTEHTHYIFVRSWKPKTIERLARESQEVSSLEFHPMRKLIVLLMCLALPMQGWAGMFALPDPCPMQDMAMTVPSGDAEAADTGSTVEGQGQYRPGQRLRHAVPQLHRPDGLRQSA